jgi:hypothetical protein
MGGPLVAIAVLLWLPGYGLLSLFEQGNAESQRLLRVRPQPPLQQLTAAQWRQGSLSGLPRQRLDLWRRNRQPFDIQYAGPLQNLSQALAADGWQPAEMLDWRNALRLLSPSLALSQFPVIPHVHQGRHEGLVLVRDDPDGNRFVLRLWETRYVVSGRGPLWIGDITRVEKERIAGLLAIPVTHAGTQTAELAALTRLLTTRKDFELSRPGQIPSGQNPSNQPPGEQLTSAQVTNSQLPSAQVRSGRPSSEQIPGGQRDIGKLPDGPLRISHLSDRMLLPPRRPKRPNAASAGAAPADGPAPAPP